MAHTSDPPSAADLREAALGYLARYASTETGLRRILGRRIEKWKRLQTEVSPEELAKLRETADQVVVNLVQGGILDDRQFAEAKGQSLRREGRSTRAARAKLLAKGVPAPLAQEAVPEDPVAELAAAVMTARRRHLGPFRHGDPGDADDTSRELARLVRAGFSMAVAQRALALEPEEAEALIQEMRR